MMKQIALFACAIFLTALRLDGQEIHIVSFDSTGHLGFRVSSTNGTSYLLSRVEWCSSLDEAWTNSWYSSFSCLATSNGVFQLKVPRFYRVVGEDRPYLGEEDPDWFDYQVDGVVSSTVANGTIVWSGTSGTTYHVEHATSANSTYWGQWAHQTNILSLTGAITSVSVPLFFRVVRISEFNP